MAELDFSDLLNQVSCPVLVVCGEKDKANKKASIELADILKHSEFKEISETGHEVNLESPEKLASLLREFYKSIWQIPICRDKVLMFWTIQIAKYTSFRTGVFCCLGGLRGAILAGDIPLKKPSADLKCFDASCQNTHVLPVTIRLKQSRKSFSFFDV